MNLFSLPDRSVNTLRVPERSRAICLAIALLAPFLAAIPDIPFGRWHSIYSDITRDMGLMGYIFGCLFFAAMTMLSVSPVVMVGVEQKNRPLVYWLSFAAYLYAVLFSCGDLYRMVGGKPDGTEPVILLIFSAFAACGGAAIGFLLDKVIASQRIQLWTVRIALAAAVLGAFSNSAIDAASFEERRSAWLEQQESMRQADDIRRWNMDNRRVEKPEITCLGYASPDGAIRLFSESECVATLGGKYFPKGECLKLQGGSFSWDLRGMNRSCQ